MPNRLKAIVSAADLDSERDDEDEMDGSTCTSGGTSLAPAQALPKGGSYPSGVSPNGKPPSGAPAAKGWTDGDVTPTESVMSADNTTVVETFAVNDL